MRLLLIDDERLALIQLEKTLRSVADRFREEVEVMALQTPQGAVAQAERFRPDAVFLDIHMPEISGLQVAELLQERMPEVMIIFLTAYDDYAIKAFELNAVDYLLKPLIRERLEKTFQRVSAKRKAMAYGDEGEGLHKKILCANTLMVQSPGQLPELPKWRTTKAQELFAYLLQRRDETVHKSTILELLSPELDKKRAMTQLYTAIYQIRQCLQSTGLDIAIHNVSIQESYILRLSEGVTVESEIWERELQLARESMPARYDRIGELLAEYDGSYLRDHDYVWAESERERLRQLWMSHARQLAVYLEEQRRDEEALKLYERLQELDPYHEAEGLAVLKLHDRLGHYDKVLSYYEHLEKLFVDELGLPLPTTIHAWLDDWRAQR